MGETVTVDKTTMIRVAQDIDHLSEFLYKDGQKWASKNARDLADRIIEIVEE